MGRIILVYKPKTTDEVKYCIDCSQVPPPAGPGDLHIPNVERKQQPGPQGYKYLSLQRLPACNNPANDDIIIEISEKPETYKEIILPFNGGYTEGHPVNEISIKLLDPGQLNP